MADVRDMIGPETLKRAQATKWWMLARALDEILYGGGTVHAESKGTGGEWLIRKPKDDDQSYNRRFFGPARVFIRATENWPIHAKRLDADGSELDVERVLRELMHECERLAVREVSP